jgi:hypothetical protein
MQRHLLFAACRRWYRVVAGLAVVALAVAYGCTRPDPALGVPSDSSLSLQVTNDSNRAVAGALVRLYRTEADFNARVGTPDTARTNAAGLATFRNLPVAQYWYYVSFDEPRRLAQLDNSQSSFRLGAPLPLGTALTVGVTLRPGVLYNGYAFWTTALAATEPVTITVSQISTTVPAGTPRTTSAQVVLNQVRPAAPTAITDPNLARLRLNPGVYAYSASAASGSCFWSGSFTVRPYAQSVQTFRAVQLADCGTLGGISVYALNSNNNNPITVILGANDTLGVLSNRVAPPNLQNPQQTYACGQSPATGNNVLVSTRPAGNYGLRAVSSTGRCIWDRQVTVTARQCTSVQLDACFE